MRATLIEIDAATPPGYWMPSWRANAGAAEGRECAVADCWLILPGQGVNHHPEPVVFAEHAWQVRDGQVELRLHEVAAEATQSGLALEPAP